MIGKLNTGVKISAESQDKETLVRAEWMDKPIDEMTEEEKKLLKEFEKKMNVLKVVVISQIEKNRKKKKSIAKRLKLNYEKSKLAFQKFAMDLT